MAKKDQPSAQEQRIEQPQPKLERYFFPRHGVTVEAENLREATKLVKAQQKGTAPSAD